MNFNNRLEDLESKTEKYEDFFQNLSSRLDFNFQIYDRLLEVQQQQINTMAGTMLDMMNDEVRHRDIMKAKYSDIVHGIYATNDLSLLRSTGRGGVATSSYNQKSSTPTVTASSSLNLNSSNHSNNYANVSHRHKRPRGNNENGAQRTDIQGSSADCLQKIYDGNGRVIDKHMLSANRFVSSPDMLRSKFLQRATSGDTSNINTLNNNNTHTSNTIPQSSNSLSENGMTYSSSANSADTTDNSVSGSPSPSNDATTDPSSNGGTGLRPQAKYNSQRKNTNNITNVPLQAPSQLASAATEGHATITASNSDSFAQYDPVDQSDIDHINDKINELNRTQDSTPLEIYDNDATKKSKDYVLGPQCKSINDPSVEEIDSIKNRYGRPVPSKKKQYTKEFIFLKGPKTVMEVWEEYAVGTKDQPSIRELEEIYGNSWRKGANIKRTYSRRKILHNAIETGLAKGYSLEKCIGILESCRVCYLEDADEEEKAKIKEDKWKPVYTEESTGLKYTLQSIGWLSHSSCIPDELKLAA